MQYDTRCYFNVCSDSEADTSQLNLPHVTKDYRSDKNEKVKNGYAQKYR